MNMIIKASISFTSNLWPFLMRLRNGFLYFRIKGLVCATSFQYGGGRLKGDYSEFTESDFWMVSNAMLKHTGERPDFIAVITDENEHPCY